MDVGPVLGSLGAIAAVLLGLGRKPRVMWLIGLMVVVRGSKPEQRAEILRAYGDAQPSRKDQP
jgi:hypothetical protein